LRPQIRVPLPESSSLKPLLLVELGRGGAAAYTSTGLPGGNGMAPAGGGDPVLVVMPKDVDGSNRIPWFSDIPQYGAQGGRLRPRVARTRHAEAWERARVCGRVCRGSTGISRCGAAFMASVAPAGDLRSYFLQQSLHYIATRDLSIYNASSASSASTASARFAEYYVAVYNNNQRFKTPNLLNSTADVTIRVGAAILPDTSLRAPRAYGTRRHYVLLSEGPAKATLTSSRCPRAGTLARARLRLELAFVPRQLLQPRNVQRPVRPHDGHQQRRRHGQRQAG
jgi:hypothetical protein